MPKLEPEACKVTGLAALLTYSEPLALILFDRVRPVDERR